MTTFYIILVGMLLLLAIFDLFVGVSNDAVNFLNSAVGSRAFKFRTLLIFAVVGVFCGATFSNGMMDIARHGIFQPEYYTFAELFSVFAAVMVTDVILLDIFNSLGMPTSTTVSMVFELLGASVAIASIKILGNDTLSLGALINTSKALSVIMGIFVSVAIAFTVGALVQYVTRLIFTFGYKKNLRYFVGVFGGVSMTSIFYFILIKGLKNMSFVGAEYKQFISSNEGLLLAGMFVGFFILCHILHALKINVLKMIIGFGTFSLALAFAGNDLVNFVGVPLTGLSSIQHLMADSGNPSEYMMGFLVQPEPGQWYLLMIAGIVMVVALTTSKKSHKVVQTSVALASQSSTDEIFGTNPVARALVRGSHAVAKFITGRMPKNFSDAIDKRFNTRDIILEEDGAAFDLLRASVNLMLASSLIALGTSLKLPLSTTYVTFMVAMGTSLADKAWSRETAVYRITGVLSVIGGWFLTAFAAFASSFIIALVLYYGGFPAKFIMFAVVVILLIRSNFFKKESSHKNESDERFERILNAAPETDVFPLIQNHNQQEWSEIIRWESYCYGQIVKGVLREDMGKLRSVRKQIKILKKHIERVRRQGTLCRKKIKAEDLILKNFFLYQANDFMGDSVFSLEQISIPCRNHVDNNFTPISEDKRKTLLRLVQDMENVMVDVAQMIADRSYENYDELRDRIISVSNKIKSIRKNELLAEGAYENSEAGSGVKPRSVRAQMLYLTILYESRGLLDSINSILKASRKFLTEKPGEMV